MKKVDVVGFLSIQIIQLGELKKIQLRSTKNKVSHYHPYHSTGNGLYGRHKDIASKERWYLNWSGNRSIMIRPILPFTGPQYLVVLVSSME